MALYRHLPARRAHRRLGSRHGRGRFVEDRVGHDGRTRGRPLVRVPGLVPPGRIGIDSASRCQAAGAQLVGALAVALLATIPMLVLPESVELDVVRFSLAGFIALVGFAVARSSGASRTRSIVYGGSVLVVAVTVAVLKNVLAGH